MSNYFTHISFSSLCFQKLYIFHCWTMKRNYVIINFTMQDADSAISFNVYRIKTVSQTLYLHIEISDEE